MRYTISTEKGSVTVGGSTPLDAMRKVFGPQCYLVAEAGLTEWTIREGARILARMVLHPL